MHLDEAKKGSQPGVRRAAYAKMIAFRFDVGVHDLMVEKLRGLRPAGNAPVVVIQQPAKEREPSLLIQDLDLHEVGELPSECLHMLVEPSNMLTERVQ